jgi:transposase, IS30 family
LIVRGLQQRHSPERICGALALGLGQNVISHEAVYTFIYSKKCIDYEPLIQYLRIRHMKKYSKRGSVQKRGVITNRVGIEYRPAIVETNTEIGQWWRYTAAGIYCYWS